MANGPWTLREHPTPWRASRPAPSIGSKGNLRLSILLYLCPSLLVSPTLKFPRLVLFCLLHASYEWVFFRTFSPLSVLGQCAGVWLLSGIFPTRSEPFYTSPGGPESLKLLASLPSWLERHMHGHCRWREGSGSLPSPGKRQLPPPL